MAIRCLHEAQISGFDNSCFVTLTYRPECMPAGLSLVPRDLTLFWKRCRKEFSFRYFAAGEYGDISGLPHYHACLFGYAFPDRVYWKRSGSGEAIYRSAQLERLWPFGHSSIGAVTFESAAYVARYVMKKEYGLEAGLRRCIVDVTTGELVEREHEFCRMSLKPGLGRGWLEKFASDVYPHGRVIINGVEVKAPRYYDLWFKGRDPVAFEKLSKSREREAEKRWDDNSPARLRAKEQVLEARVSLLKREM